MFELTKDEKIKVVEYFDHLQPIKYSPYLPKAFTKNKTIKLQPIYGKKGYSIGHYAEILRADLLVMPAPPKISYWDRLFTHDMEHILAELPTDVLILR